MGPVGASITLIGEALGRQEALQGKPFVGPAGIQLDKILRHAGLEREQLRIDNCVRCQPPNDWLVGAPWEWQALQKCSQYISQTLRSTPTPGVVVALGSSATRRLLNLPSKKHKQENWHGSPTWNGSHWIVPTYHPSFLLRGNHKLTGVCVYDFHVAQQVAAGEWKSDPANLVVDPDAQWFESWVDEFLAEVESATSTPWLAVDIETVEKLGGDEGELVDGPGGEIVRVNFSHSPGEGITIPWGGPYRRDIERLLRSKAPKILWNARYDIPRIRASGITVHEPILDFMWGWHVLQSDLPRGLGFVAPFYSNYGAWKHLSSSDPGTYAAIDAVQTIRCGFGIARDLKKSGQWDIAFYRHIYKLDTLVLHPAEKVGLKVDKKKLDDFCEDLEKEKSKLNSEIQVLVPDSLRPEKDWKRAPKDTTDLVELSRSEAVQCCLTCRAIEVAKTHRCQDRSLQPVVEVKTATVQRWVKKLEFNSASPKQLLGYLAWKGHKGGRSKKSKTNQPSTDRKVLEKLFKTTKDPFYGLVLKLRKVDKVLGTYVKGAQKRLGQDGRLHSQFTHKPSTGRKSSTNPNLQNVKTDRDVEEDPITTGFRGCLVAEDGCRLVEADFCVSPETRILRSDLTWVRADTIRSNDEVIGFGESLDKDSKWLSATVLGTRTITRPRVRVVTTLGSIDVATNHPFVARYNSYRRRWVVAEKLRPGMLMSFLCPPWEKDESHEGGYLAGFFDGEGWVTRSTVGFGQNSGPTLEYVLELLKKRKFGFVSMNNSSTAQAYAICHLRGALRFVGSIRPQRLMAKSRQMWEGRRTWGKRAQNAVVLRLEPLEDGPVVALETTTRTYISEGFLSHNSGVEAIQTGWYAGDEDYLRLARLGVHAYLASYLLKRPASLTWSDEELGIYFKEIKKKFKTEYDRAKRCVHGTNYGLTPIGMVNNYPEIFTRSSAEAVQRLYFELCPKLQKWQTQVRLRAAKNGYLGGSDHPFKYKHWFWNVFNYNKKSGKWTLGEDSKRAVAFYPQSTAAGVLHEACLRLLDQGGSSYIGDLYFGKTPLRAIVHDSILLEVPEEKLDRAIECLVSEMTKPIVEQSGLKIDVAVKVGKDWLDMEEIDLREVGVASDTAVREAEEDEEASA